MCSKLSHTSEELYADSGRMKIWTRMKKSFTLTSIFERLTDKKLLAHLGMLGMQATFR